MTEDSRIRAARDATWKMAMQRGLQREEIASPIVLNAELEVLRRLISGQLPGGEVEYWALVGEELKR
jgi:hypothetical protein